MGIVQSIVISAGIVVNVGGSAGLTTIVCVKLVGFPQLSTASHDRVKVPPLHASVVPDSIIGAEPTSPQLSVQDKGKPAGTPAAQSTIKEAAGGVSKTGPSVSGVAVII